MRTEHRRDHFEDYTLITIIASIVLLFAGIVLNCTFICTSNYDNYKITEQKRMEAMEQSIIEYRRNNVHNVVMDELNALNEALFYKFFSIEITDLDDY